jgi:glyoxylase-like metal-dependent hydrolase (beta-lactamase superfamily II)
LKKFVGLLLIAMLVLGACAAPAETPAETPASTPPVTSEPGPEPSPTTIPTEIHPLVTKIEISHGFNSVYLIRGEKTALIDTGPGASTLGAVEQAIEELGMSIGDIDLILNTHLHWDHTGGNTVLQNASNAQIFIHTDEADYLENPELYIDWYLVPAIEVILGQEYVVEEKEKFLKLAVSPMTVDRRLEDGDIIELGAGLDLQVVHLPGHSPGSVGYYIEEAGIIFVGDSVEGVHGVRGALPVIDDLEAYEKSLERLLEMPLKVMVKAHPSESITIPGSLVVRDGEIKQFLEESLEFTHALREAAESVAPGFPERSFWELYDEVVGKFPVDWGMKPTSELPKPPFHGGVTLLNVFKQIKN